MSWVNDHQNARTQAAMGQLVDWARAWVENETSLLETKREDMRPAESDALLLLAIALEHYKSRTAGGV